LAEINEDKEICEEIKLGAFSWACSKVG